MKLPKVLKKVQDKVVEWCYRFMMTDAQKKVEQEVTQAVYKFAEDRAEIVDIVKKKGFVILHDALSMNTISEIKKEFRKIIAEDLEKFSSVDRHDGATCIRIKPFLTLANSKKYPSISAFYFTPVLKKITESFYKPNRNIEYVSEIFVHETPETDDPLSNAAHWDRAQTLKFWIYVDDLPAEAGPMLIDPDSVEYNKNTRVHALNSGRKLVGGVDNLADADAAHMVALTANQGSILIHDTDASHGSSTVKPGFTRRIIRGHCREK